MNKLIFILLILIIILVGWKQKTEEPNVVDLGQIVVPEDQEGPIEIMINPTPVVEEPI